MPIFQTCAVILDGKKEVYRKGETVTGSLVLDVTEDVTVKAVRVYLYGQTLVKWKGFSSGSHEGTMNYVAKERYLGLVHTVFGKKENTTGRNHTLTAGRHNYRYEFNLPKEGLPSSLEVKYGAIRYWVKVEVDSPVPKFNQCWYRGITILDDINVNDPQYKASVRRQAKKQVSKVLGLGDAGTLTLRAATDRGAYCAGEMIALNVVAKNESTKDMGKLKAQLRQIVVYTANNETKTRENVIRVLEETPVMKGEERVWNNQLLKVDAIPPSTKTRFCHIIAVSYFITVLVEVPLGFNLETTLPITIGTIPYGHTPATAGATAGPSTEIDAFSAITYTKCKRGFEVCRQSEGNFVNYKYTPMCAYVLNYTFPPPSSLAGGAVGRRPSRGAEGKRHAGGAAEPRPAAVVTAAQPKLVCQSRKVPPASIVQTSSITPAPLQPPSQVPPQAPPQVSALPMEKPPSYEDALKMVNLAATSETAVTPEVADKPHGLLFLRFPDTSVQEFRDTIGKEHQSLAECEGEIIAFAPQVLHDHNEWLARTSVAILKFPSVEMAGDWFNKTPGVADSKWLGTCDAISATMKEQFREANRVFSMTRSRCKMPVRKAKIDKYCKLCPKRQRPFRLLQTGVILVSSAKFTTLRGSWLEDKDYLTVSQWETMDLYFEYRFKRKTGQFKECYDLLGDIADVRPSVIFQSEDLSLFQMTSIQTTERSDSPGVEFQSQNTQAEAESNASGDVNGTSGNVKETSGNVKEASGNVNKTSGKRRAESTRSESPAVEVQSEDIANGETQTQSEASGDGEDADGEDEEETVDTGAPLADLL
ncbi:uncharacterized protein [Haliotis asinina]|uniref:uncharacterized protein n=1 Tax=Haliotis asinina TaxID=109174 RepID=UPI003531F20B